MEHHKATTAEGWTIVQRAVIEHNILALSNFYRTVTFSNLGRILGINADKAEKVAARMIQEGRMNGEIDQVQSIVRFQSGDEQSTWNDQIKSTCEQVNY